MIENDVQLNVSQERAASLRKSVFAFDAAEQLAKGIHPRLVQAQRAALASQLADLEQEILNYMGGTPLVQDAEGTP